MEKYIKYICLVLIIGVMTAFASQAKATPLPWLDFGNSFIWDPNNALYTDDGNTGVTEVTYQDGTNTNDSLIIPPLIPGGDPVIGVIDFNTPEVLETKVDLDLSFDGIQNDTIKISDGTTDFLTADIDIVNPAFDPINATPNPFIAKLDNIFIDPGPNNSRWAEEFQTTINGLGGSPELRLTFFGVALDNGDGTFTINGGGKVLPNPEPGTMILMGIGLIGVAGAGIRRKYKKGDKQE